MDKIISHPSNDNYRANFDNIFKSKKEEQPVWKIDIKEDGTPSIELASPAEAVQIQEVLQ